MHNGWWLLSTQTWKPHLQCADGWWYGHESPFLQFGQNLHLSGRPPPLPPSPTSATRTETNKLLVRNFLRQMCTRMDGVLIKKKYVSFLRTLVPLLSIVLGAQVHGCVHMLILVFRTVQSHYKPCAGEIWVKY